MKLILNEDNYLEVYAELDYYIYYKYGVFEADKEAKLEDFTVNDLILTSSKILENIDESEIEIDVFGIRILANNKFYKFISVYNKIEIRKWINSQVTSKERLDDYVRFNYEATFNKLTKDDLLDIVLDYL